MGQTIAITEVSAMSDDLHQTSSGKRPVSYTHLDVYKRQARECFDRVAQGALYRADARGGLHHPVPADGADPL